MQRGKKEKIKPRGGNTKGKEMPKSQRSSEKNEIETLATQLREEKRKSAKFQLETVRLKKHVEVLSRTLKSTRDELDQKRSVINKMIEKSLDCCSTSDEANSGEMYSSEGDGENAVEDLDIDSLLQANLGAVNITDILNISECDNNFLPNDLPDLSMLAEAENEKDCSTEVAGAEGRSMNTTSLEEKPEEKTIVQILADQNNDASVNAKEKVSPLKFIKENDQYKLSKRKRQSDVGQPEAEAKKRRLNDEGKVNRSQKCPHCAREFPLGGAWKLKKHIISNHNDLDQELSCSICQQRFGIRSVLEAHMERHRKSFPWSCALCGDRFDQLTSFVTHGKSRHKIHTVEQTMNLCRT